MACQTNIYFVFTDIGNSNFRYLISQIYFVISDKVHGINKSIYRYR